MKIGIIGLGHMGTALLEGLVKSYPREILFVTSRTAESAQLIATKHHVNHVISKSELAKHVDIIILATKPNVYQSILEEISPFLTHDKIIISLTPSFSLASLKSIINKPIKVVRTIPNTPAKINRGTTLISFDDTIEDEEKSLIKELFSALGDVFEVQERELAVASTLSGSSPAFIEFFMKTLIDYGVENGLDADLSRKLVVTTFLGTSSLVTLSDLKLEDLITCVCSKGGSTIEGIVAFDQEHLADKIKVSIDQTTRRFKEMENENDPSSSLKDNL